MQPLISIIIPTKNSERTLEDCLVSIEHQSYSNIEVIVVDNFSTDDTQTIARKYTNQVLEKWPERTEQKNYAISKSHGEYLCFIDSDMILTENVIQECWDAFMTHKKAGWICIRERSVWAGIFVQIRDFERSFYSGTSVESARFFRKSDVEAVGWFEEDLIFFEESLLPQKIENMLGLHCNISINSYIHHQEGYIGIIKWLKKKFYYGKSLNAYQKKVQEKGIKSTGQWQISILWRYMIFLKNKRFYTRPFLAVWVLVLKTLEFWAGGMGLIYTLIHPVHGK